MSDEFGTTIDERKESDNKPKYRKTEFLNLDPGEHRIRILEPRETKKYTHYLGWVYVECLGDECPICQNNKKILYEHPEDYRTVKGWSPRSARYYINVLDKTLTKVCSKCGTESHEATSTCPACTTIFGEPQPLNKVKVLSMGSELLDSIKVLSNSIRSEADERIDIRTYDYTLTVKGVKTNKKTTPAPKWYPGREALETVEEGAMFDLENVAVKLSASEMLDVFNGASLKDVFALRRAKKDVLNSDMKVTENVSEDIAASVDKMFGL